MRTNMSYRTLTIAALLMLTVASTAGAAIVKGPYLQHPTQSTMTVVFQSDADELATVEWGPAEDDYTGSLDATHVGVIDFPVDGERYIYKFHLDGLERGTTYHYRVTQGVDVSDDRTFVTAPYNMDGFNFVAFGDSRGGSIDSPNLDHEMVVAAIKDYAPMFYVNTGDFVASGEDPNDWNYFFQSNARPDGRFAVFSGVRQP
ncbi:MAG: fibronectin type III domain-containing protein [Deltaproteobacteria bacterium]|nr:fibronectin type III domain-containing protein [Deltaproteobacteria bacterium]